jgi:hypothetical protein
MLMLGAAGVIFWLQDGKFRLATLLSAMLILLDLYPYAHRFVSSELSPTTQVSSYQLDQIPAQPAEERVSTLSPIPDNFPALAGLRTISGYYQARLARYSNYSAHAITTAGTDWALRVDALPADLRAFDFLGVSHIFSTSELAVTSWQLVRQSGDLWVYENPNAFPRAFMVSDVVNVETPEDALQAVLDPNFSYADSVVLEQPITQSTITTGGSEVIVTGFGSLSGYLRLDVSIESDGILVISDPWYSERRGFVDGVEAPVLRADYAFSAIEVPAGEHIIELRYIPTSLYLGASVTMGVALMCLVVVGIEMRGVIIGSQSARLHHGGG